MSTLSKEEQINGNRQILEALGYRVCRKDGAWVYEIKDINTSSKTYIPVESVQYHLSYDMLIPAWVKIRDKIFGFIIKNLLYNVPMNECSKKFTVAVIGNNDITAAWKVVIEAIDWYDDKVYELQESQY
ncbi:MAG: hypothetical protein ACTHMD_07085 [Flavisolibacter sp.]